MLKTDCRRAMEAELGPRLHRDTGRWSYIGGVGGDGFPAVRQPRGVGSPAPCATEAKRK